MKRISQLLEYPRYQLGPTGKRLMKRMSRSNWKILLAEFDRNPDWEPEKVEDLSKRLEISKAKVYKWNWDQKNKLKNAIFSQVINDRNKANRMIDVQGQYNSEGVSKE